MIASFWCVFRKKKWRKNRTRMGKGGRRKRKTCTHRFKVKKFVFFDTSSLVLFDMLARIINVCRSLWLRLLFNLNLLFSAFFPSFGWAVSNEQRLFYRCWQLPLFYYHLFPMQTERKRVCERESEQAPSTTDFRIRFSLSLSQLNIYIIR